MNIKHSFYGFIIFVILINISCSKISVPTDGIYLIPKGYTGDVIIIFDQPDGIVPEIESGFYLYKIPKDGILKVKTKGVTGYVNKSYYYIDENNGRQKIEYLRVTGERDSSGMPQNKHGNITQNEYENEIYVMNAGGLGSFNTKKGVVQYTSFIIGTPKDGDDFYDKKQKRISEIHREFLQDS